MSEGRPVGAQRSPVEGPGSGEIGLLALAFLRTARRDGGVTTEHLGAPDDLARWLASVGLAGARIRPSLADLSAALALRAAIGASGAAVARGRAPGAAEIAEINRAARRRPLHPRLDPQASGWGWRGKQATPGALSVIAADAIQLLGGPLRAQLRLCAAPGCAMPFVDRSRPGRRRWCSVVPCADRAKKAAARQRAGAGSRRGAGGDGGA